MNLAPWIVFLDQNKWIELLRAEKDPQAFPDHSKVLHALLAKVKAGRVIVPLTSTNIYETYKISDRERKFGMASLQARLSRGLVFRGRYHRLERELSAFLEKTYRLKIPSFPVLWFLSDNFFEAFCDNDDARLDYQFSSKFIEWIRQNSGQVFHHFITSTSDEDRFIAVSDWSKGSEALRARIEERRKRHSKESLPMRRRIYSALLIIEEIQLLAQFAEKHGVNWDSMDDITSPIIRKLVNEVPVYYTGRELVLRLEAQNRPINENDFRDLMAYCAAIPYADEIIGENQMINLARQARLGEKYKTKLDTDLRSLSCLS